MTQFDAGVVRAVGFAPTTKTGEAFMTGAGLDEGQSGYVFRTSKLFALGKRFENVEIASFNLSALAKAGIDGLLGFDVISRLHLEMIGPTGILRVY
jgi:hypothetical protein